MQSNGHLRFMVGVLIDVRSLGMELLSQRLIRMRLDGKRRLHRQDFEHVRQVFSKPLQHLLGTSKGVGWGGGGKGGCQCSSTGDRVRQLGRGSGGQTDLFCSLGVRKTDQHCTLHRDLRECPDI